VNTENLLQSRLVQSLIKPILPPKIRHGARRLESWLRGQSGYIETQWLRVVYHDQWKHFFSTLPTEQLSLLEVSPGPVAMWREQGWAKYTPVQFPTFDITKDTLPQQFDVIIAEHVFEHLRHPYSAAKNIYSMLNHDGIFLIATPLLVRVHNEPGDYTRWTEMALSGFLEDTGFTSETHSWGNSACLIANLGKWERFRKGRDLRNEPNLPLVIWAYARKKTWNTE
jgi:SAM-dependent methyltransferase